MFKNVKNKMKRDKLVRLLGFLVQAATVIPEGAAAPVGFALIPEKDAKELVENEPTFVAINPNVPADKDGKVQTAVLKAGLEAYQAAQAASGTQAPAANTAASGSTSTDIGAAASAQTAAVEFAISNDIPLPTINRGGGAVRESKYPFAKLEIGQSFFVPGTTTKAFGSTINGQNRKFSKTSPKRKFTLRAVTENNVAGVRVWRIAVSEPAANTGGTQAPAAPAQPVAGAAAPAVNVPWAPAQ